MSANKERTIVQEPPREEKRKERSERRARGKEAAKDGAAAPAATGATVVRKRRHVPKREVGPVRLYAKGTFTGYRRSRENIKPEIALLNIDGVKTSEQARFYLGKRVAYVYHAKRKIKDSNTRVTWGRIVRTHGNSGVVRARFRRNLPPRAMGAPIRVMLYPSNI
eukprot:TRINITY_DN4_c0_g1_i1.p1 TRINITY_DN4_c0_g1~~TRINITY_DN4_c0_g1_i1.p1  ORF type:complete len:165 (+),score=40.87 TRINITY_DN4_c0_g1_i1:52-546(+)